MATINGVLGPLDTADLGFTLMHEHILIANWSMRVRLSAIGSTSTAHKDYAVGELKSSAKERGVCYASWTSPAINLGRDIHVMREVGRTFAEIQVIAATGPLLDRGSPGSWVGARTSSSSWFIRDIDRTASRVRTSKAGIIKCATDHHGVSPTSIEKLLKASGAAPPRAAGVPISTHTSRSRTAPGSRSRTCSRKEGVDLCAGS